MGCQSQFEKNHPLFKIINRALVDLPTHQIFQHDETLDHY